jgi:hypothetical protein
MHINARVKKKIYTLSCGISRRIKKSQNGCFRNYSCENPEWRMKGLLIVNISSKQIDTRLRILVADCKILGQLFSETDLSGFWRYAETIQLVIGLN